MGIGEFLPKYTDLTFANLKKENVEFIWSDKQQKAFDRLIVIMAKKPVVKILVRKGTLRQPHVTIQYLGYYHKKDIR